MNLLADQDCEACCRDASPISAEEAQELLATLPDWTIETPDDPEGLVPRLVRVFVFANFREALAFTQGVGELAEAADHHPALLTEWGRVTVSWWTHSIRGLHRNDFILAAKTERLFTGSPQP